ncbi:hypothetical protein WA577_001042 [Blastocystis sp. JDR]
MYCSDETGGIVVDIGSSSIKLGYGGEDVPKAVYPSSYGFNSQDPPTYYLGTQDLNTRRDQMDVFSSFMNGKISNYDAIEKLLDYGITAGLRYKASEHPLLIVEDPFSFAEQRMKLAELMFEKLGFPAIYFIKSSSCIGWRFLICIILSFSLGKTTCMSVDFGASGIRVVPVYDGYPLMTASAVSPYGGDYLNSLLFDKLSSQKIQVTPHCFLKKQIVEGVVANIQRIDFPNTRASFLKYAIMDIVRDMKECCFHLASKPIKQSPPPTTPISYTLPDNQEVHLDQDAYYIPEVIMTGNGTDEGPPLPNTIYSCIQNCDVEIRKELTSNIVLAGGGCCMKGLSARLDSELSSRLNASFKPKLYSSEPIYSPFNAWTGGSIIVGSSLGSFQQMWISKEEYKEKGREIISSRCNCRE